MEEFDFNQPMTLADFILLQPIIINEVVSACTIGDDPAAISEISNDRQIEIANRISDLAHATTDLRSKAILEAVAAQLFGTEPDY